MALSSSQTKMLIGGVVVVAVIGFLINAGLNMAGSKIAENAMERAIGDNADVKMKADGTMDITTDEGTVSTGNKVPADWPKDAPVYPGATVQYSGSVSPTTGTEGTALILVTTDSAADVTAYYETKLTSEGWTMGGTMEGGATTIMSATKDTRTFALAVTESEGQTSISLGIETKSN